jgi:hypothetical protein
MNAVFSRMCTFFSHIWAVIFAVACKYFPLNLLMNLIVNIFKFSVSIVVISLEYFCPSVQIGFWCDDPSISFKFKGESFPMHLVAIFTVAVLLWVIFVFNLDIQID